MNQDIVTFDMLEDVYTEAKAFLKTCPGCSMGPNLDICEGGGPTMQQGCVCLPLRQRVRDLEAWQIVVSSTKL